MIAEFDPFEETMPAEILIEHLDSTLNNDHIEQNYDPNETF